MAVLICRDMPFVSGLIIEISLSLLFGDEGATDGVLEFGDAHFWILDDVNEIAAESLVMDDILDLER